MVRGNLTAMVWKDKRNVNMLTNMHHLPAEGNFCEEHGNALKPAIIQGCNKHMGHMDKNYCMIYTYSISRQTCKWKKKLFFHLLDLIINSYILLNSCRSKSSHRDFQISLIRALIQDGTRMLATQITSQEMPTISTGQLEVRYSVDWLQKRMKQRCHVHSVRKKKSRTIYVC
jgi:hypothetical protein